MIASDFQKNPSNQFEKPPQTLTQSPLNCWRQADRLSYPGTGNFTGKLNEYSRPIRTGNGQPSVRTDHLSKRSSFFVPMFHPDQFRRRHVALIRPADSRGSKRYQPYWGLFIGFNISLKVEFVKNCCYVVVWDKSRARFRLYFLQLIIEV